MIELLNGVLLGGLLAAAAPLLIHIAHRRRVRTQPWGAMRFLAQLMAKRRRRLSVDRWLLLLLRMLALACLAFALTRPVLRLGAEGERQVVRQGATAAVLLVDDSLSTGAGRRESASVAARRIAESYLATLRPGDEVSVIAASRLGAPAADPLYDLAAARELVAGLAPTTTSCDIPALLEAGLAQLGRHLNPGAELVLVTDGRAEGWRTGDRLRWDELRRRLQGAPDSAAGTRARPRVVMLAPEPPPLANIAVTALRIDRALVPAGRRVTVRATLARRGGAGEGSVLRLAVDGRPIEERRLGPSRGSEEDVAFAVTFAEPGSYVVEAAVEGARDDLPADDRRALAVAVERRVPVLLVEGKRGEGVDGSLGMVAAALDPELDNDGLFRVERIAAGELAGRDLAGARVVVLGDVPALDAGAVAALERLVVAGGGILCAPGPATDVELANRFWSRGGHGFLPVEIAAAVDCDPATAPGPTSDPAHPAFEAFGPRAGEAWSRTAVRRHLVIDPGEARADDRRVLLAFADGAPMAVERARGLGRAIVLALPLDLAWSDLPAHAAFVPLVRGLVSHLAANVLPPRNLAPGARIVCAPLGQGDHASATLEGPAGALPIAVGDWEGRPALLSEPALALGAYAVRTNAGAAPLRFAIAADPAESQLEPQRPDDLAGAVRGLAWHRFAAPEEVGVGFSGAGRRAVELWRWLVALSVLLLLAETVLTRRQVAAERDADRAAARGAA